MQRKHGDRRRKADMFRLCSQVGEDELGRRIHAQCAEMMLPDPGGMHAELFGEQRLLDDFADELVGGAAIAGILIVAQCEITKFQRFLPVFWLKA